LQFLLSAPAPLLFSALVLFVTLSFGCGLAVLHVAGHLFKDGNDQVPIPAFLGIIATAWALSLGFAASDVWALGARADLSVSAERSAIKRLLGTAAPAALNIPEMHKAVLDYRRLVEETEWRLHQNRQADPAVDEALQAIRVALIKMSRAGETQALVTKSVRDFDELQDARNERLAIGQSMVDESKWYLVLSLTLLTMATIGILHADRPKAGRNALVIYSVAVLVSLWILALHTNPYAATDFRAASISKGSVSLTIS
jgi:hypothetical protein